MTQPSAQLEFLAKRDLGRPFARHWIARVERPSSLALVGPVVRALVAAPEKAVAARRPQLEARRLFDQLLGQRELHRPLPVPVPVALPGPAPVPGPAFTPASSGSFIARYPCSIPLSTLCTAGPAVS